MRHIPLAVLLAWIPFGLYLFHRFPVRVAALLNFIGGWAILPTANFVPSPVAFPYWILGVDLPAGYFLTKATVTSLTALIGLLLFHRRAIRGFRLSLCDTPMILWCIVPLLSAIANRSVYTGALREGLRGVLYICLAWGVPYLIGRLCFRDYESLLVAARAFVTAGLLYIPICLIELFTGPQFYAHLYGYQPYRWLGAERYIGFRPIGFLEDGNQLGIWMATATLLAFALWRRRLARRVLGLPMSVAAVALLVMTLLCQSVGSIILLLCLLPLALVGRAGFRRLFVAALALGILCFAGLSLASLVPLRSLVNRYETAHAIAGFMSRIGRGSFGWRLVQDERHVRTALTRPVLGWGRWNWWQGGQYRPWGLWLLVYGMYGAVGLLALETMQFLPVFGMVWFPLARDNLAETALRPALAAVILLAAMDNLLNGSMILPLMLVIGGIMPDCLPRPGEVELDKAPDRPDGQ
jgi:hypothetical protein